MEKLLNNVCLDERIDTGTFDIANNDHIDVMREYLVNRGIEENQAVAFTNRVVEGGKHPERQAYNKNGILVTFPTPQHKQNAIRRGTHFEKDPTKGKPNLFGPGPDGKPRRGPGRPAKDDAEKASGEYTPPAEGGGQSITPQGDVSTLPVSGTSSDSAPAPGDTAVTMSAPEAPGESGPTEPAEQGPPDVLPAKPPQEKEQDRKAIQQMMAAKNTGLGSPLNTEPTPVAKDPENDKTINETKVAMKNMLKQNDYLLDRIAAFALEHTEIPLCYDIIAELQCRNPNGIGYRNI